MSEQMDRVLERAAVDAGLKGCRVLNVPGGDGALSMRLLEAGMEPTSADLFPEKCRPGAGPSVFCDMNQRLPFETAEFDAVLCQEGIEHLENPACFLRECARVLRPGAHLWLTTPNFMDISSRLAFLLTGQKSFHAGLPNEVGTLWGRDGDLLYHGHAFTLPFFQLRYLMRVAGFERIELRGYGRSTTSMLLYPLVRTLGGLLLRLGQRRRRGKERRAVGKRVAPDALLDELYRLAMSRALLCSKKILVSARLGAP